MVRFSTDEEIKSAIASIVFPRESWPSRETHLPPRVLFVSAIKTTGKTTFGMDVASGVFRHGWVAYGKKRSSSTSSVDRAHFSLDEFRGAPVVAFGDALRETVYSTLGLPKNYDYEKNKERPLLPAPEGKFTLRDAMIAVGSIGRKQDVAIWSKIALSKFFVPRGSERSEPIRAICSDHRFVSEYEHAVRAGVVPTTIRLFRMDVPIPDAKIESEHDLDNFPTDFLLIAREPRLSESQSTNSEKIGCAKACELWPFYESYEPVGVVSETEKKKEEKIAV